jgi:hypothetical protein
VADALDLAAELEEFRALRGDQQARNADFWLLRQAFQGLFRWPDDWPANKPKLRVPLIKKMVLVHAAMLMGKLFELDVEPLDDSTSARDATEAPEKALAHLLATGSRRQHLNRSAILGSLLGVSGFKTFMNKVEGKDVADFHAIQPELAFPITRGDNDLDLAKVFYGYTIDRHQAAAMFGADAASFQSEREVEDTYKGPGVVGARLSNAGTGGQPYIVTGNYAGAVSTQVQDRRIPVLEVWTPDQYAYWVGGQEQENGSNPYEFIPFTFIPNIDGGFGIYGESDVDQILEINEELNQLVSHMAYIEKRYMNPTYKWLMAPENYVDLATRIAGGGGILPLYGRSDVSLLEIPVLPAEYGDLVDRLRMYGVELGGLSELAFSGEAGGSINTGASLTVNFTNVLATLDLKRTNWTTGLSRVMGQMLYHMEKMKDIGIVTETGGMSAGGSSGLIKLTGKDIKGHRRVIITWPGVLPKDDIGAARLVIEQVGAGVLSRRTGMEKLGVRYPGDELELIKEEQRDPDLNPEGQATLTRANAQQQQVDQQAVEGEGEETPPEGADFETLNETPPGFGTTSAGNIQDLTGRTLPPEEADLVRFQARQQRGAQGTPEPGAPPA